MKILISVISILLGFTAAAQDTSGDLQAYQFFSPSGEKISFSAAIDLMAEHEVVLFGEHHDHAMIHWLQLKTAQALSEKKPLVMGGEIFETDNQLLLDEYIAGLVNDKRFEAEVKLWPNYVTDYKPLLQFARERGYPFIGTNVPRRYAALVSQQGLDTLSRLSPEAQALLPALPIAFSMETPGYPEMMEMMRGGGMGQNFDPENFVKAQAIKDATMASRILESSKAKSIFLHINGDYHSADFGGIYWYMKKAQKNLKICTVKIVTADEFNFQSEWEGSGSLILLVPEDFTRTH